MIIHVLSSVHRYADSPKFPKRAINVFFSIFELWLLRKSVFEVTGFFDSFYAFYNWAVFLKIDPFWDVAETVWFFPNIIQNIGKRFLISIKSRRKRLEVSRSLENFTYKCK